MNNHFTLNEIKQSPTTKNIHPQITGLWKVDLSFLGISFCLWFQVGFIFKIVLNKDFKTYFSFFLANLMKMFLTKLLEKGTECPEMFLTSLKRSCRKNWSTILEETKVSHLEIKSRFFYTSSVNETGKANLLKFSMHKLENGVLNH